MLIQEVQFIPWSSWCRYRQLCVFVCIIYCMWLCNECVCTFVGVCTDRNWTCRLNCWLSGRCSRWSGLSWSVLLCPTPPPCSCWSRSVSAPTDWALCVLIWTEGPVNMDTTRNCLDITCVCVVTEKNLDSFLQQNLFGLIADNRQQLGVC